MKYTLAKFPSAYGAYSLRRITPTTVLGQVNIIKIKKASNAEELIITSNSTGDLDVASIADFCTGTTCTVVVWYDQSGSQRDLVSIGNAPIIFESGAIITGTNGRPAIKFSGDGHLQTAATHNAAAEFTIFTVAQFNTNTNSGEYIIKFPESDIRRIQTSARMGASFGASTFETKLNTEFLPIKNFNESSVTCVIHQIAPTQSGISFGGTELLTSTILTPGTTASKIIVGSSTEAGANRLNGRIQEILYYQHNKIQDKFEIETELNAVYESSHIFRSELDTIENSYVSPRFAYSLRISKPVLHTLINHNRTADQLAASGILPLIEIAAFGNNILTRAYVYPDINGTISLNSIVKLNPISTFTFTKAIPTLGELLGNPKYSATGATHRDGRVFTWFNQAYSRDVANPLLSGAHLVFPGAYENAPLIYAASEGVIKTLNGKPCMVFENGSQYLKGGEVTSTTLLQTTSNRISSADGFLNFILGSVNAITAGRQNLLKITHTSGGAEEELLSVAVGNNAGDASKIIGSILLEGGTSATDTSLNALVGGSQYLISSGRAFSSFYTTGNGVSDTKGTLGANPKTAIAPMYITVGGSNFAGKIQEVVGFNLGGESYKIDLEEEFNRYYNIQTLASLSQSVTTSYSQGLRAIYSLRKLGNSTVGKILKIRRSSDNLERIVFSDGEGRISYLSPTSISEDIPPSDTLGNFCNGTNCTVVTWYDQSGYNVHVNQATAAYQPKIHDSATGLVTVNRLPAIKFNGSKLTSTSLFLESGQPVSTLIVYKTAVNNTDIKHILALVGTANNLHQYMQSGTVYIRNSAATLRSRTVTYPIDQSISATTFSGTTTGDARGGLSILTKTIDTSGTSSFSTATPSTNITGINIGCKTDTDTTELYNGDIQEIVVWTTWGNVPQLHVHDFTNSNIVKITASNYYKVY